MIRWDYIIVHLKTADDLNQEMCKNGDLGWEAVSAGPLMDRFEIIGWFAVMKREIRD